MICKLQKKVYLWYIKGLKITNTWNVGERGEWDSGIIVGTWDSLQFQLFFTPFSMTMTITVTVTMTESNLKNEEQDYDFDMIAATTVLQLRLQGSKWLWLNLKLAAPQEEGRDARQRGWAAVWTQFPEKESAEDKSLSF